VLTRLPVLAEAVVELALLGVAEHLIRLGDLLEAILRARVLVDVRMVLARELPVRLADVLGARTARDAEGLVVVVEADRHPRQGGVVFSPPHPGARARSGCR